MGKKTPSAKRTERSGGGPDLLVPSSIPWEELKGRLLEECLFFLLDSLRARDLQWRLGGSGGGAADQGRDIEALVPETVEDGGVVMRRWWIEAKGRTQTVEARVVKEACNNSLAFPELDVLAVATNTHFSNPTREWVKKWQQAHPQPRVVLWDRPILERMLMRHPSVAARLFVGALSDQGRLEFVRARFWDHLIYPGVADLAQLWNTRESLTWTAMARFAVLVGEAGNGDLAKRPWLAEVSRYERLEILAVGAANAPQLWSRAEALGTTMDPIYRGLAHVVLFCVTELSHSLVAGVLTNPWKLFDQQPDFPREVRKALDQCVVQPVLQQALDEMRDVCISPCERVSYDDLSKEDMEKRYSLRFLVADRHPPEGRHESLLLFLEKRSAPCQVGFRLNKENGCPFGYIVDASKHEPGSILEMLQRVAIVRLRLVHLREGMPPASVFPLAMEDYVEFFSTPPQKERVDLCDAFRIMTVKPSGDLATSTERRYLHPAFPGEEDSLFLEYSPLQATLPEAGRSYTLNFHDDVKSFPVDVAVRAIWVVRVPASFAISEETEYFCRLYFVTEDREITISRHYSFVLDPKGAPVFSGRGLALKKVVALSRGEEWTPEQETDFTEELAAWALRHTLGLLSDIQEGRKKLVESPLVSWAVLVDAGENRAEEAGTGD